MSIRPLLAIDPGNIESAYVIWDGSTIYGKGKIPNAEMLAKIADMAGNKIVIEMVACYGMPVGKDIFDTVLWIGRFVQLARYNVALIYRKDVKMHLCNSMKAKDSNIRQALIDKHGAPGRKNSPGKTYGVSGDIWAALAIADTALENPSVLQACG